MNAAPEPVRRSECLSFPPYVSKAKPLRPHRALRAELSPAQECHLPGLALASHRGGPAWPSRRAGPFRVYRPMGPFRANRFGRVRNRYRLLPAASPYREWKARRAPVARISRSPSTDADLPRCPSPGAEARAVQSDRQPDQHPKARLLRRGDRAPSLHSPSGPCGHGNCPSSKTIDGHSL